MSIFSVIPLIIYQRKCKIGRDFLSVQSFGHLPYDRIEHMSLDDAKQLR